MGWKATAWGAAFVTLGLALAVGWIGQAWTLGPRIGAATVLLVMGLLVASLGNIRWFLRLTTRAVDYEGGCPAGSRCACGQFNLKPRALCKACGAAVAA